LAIKYNQPVRISTKGTIFQIPEYLAAVAKAPHLFWVAFSIITPDDDLLEKIDRQAPNATERLKTMSLLSGVGVKTALRFRPIFPRISDATPRYPHAYRALIEKSAEAGACAVSYEVGFVPGMMDTNVRWRWTRFAKIAGVPWAELYDQFGPRQACMRPPVVWTENIMHAIRDEAHRNGLVVGVSDPVWKQLSDSGCCCGIMPDDPVFGNWERESATNQLLLARDEGKILGPEDIIPSWAYDVDSGQIYNPGTGPLVAYKRRHEMWADKLRQVWNNTKGERGPLTYFQGALLPVRVDGDGDVYYKYVGLQRKHPPPQMYWSL
jgi:hypothetical protein